VPAILRSPVWPDPRAKPPHRAVEIDWSHPLSRGLALLCLANEGGGPSQDLVGRRGGVLVGSGAGIWGPTLGEITGDIRLGYGVGSSVALSYVELTPTIAVSDSTTATATGMTVLVSHGVLPGAGGAITRRYWICPWLAVSNAGADVLFYTWGVAGAGNFDDVVSKHRRRYVATWTPSDSTLRVWGDKVLLSTHQDTRGIDPTRHGSTVRLGGHTSGVGDGNVFVGYLALWRRALTDSERDWVTDEPFAFLRSVIRRRWFVPPAGAVPVSATASPPWEAVARVAPVGKSTPWESLSPVTPQSGVSPWEALTRATAATTGPWEALARVSTARAVPWEGLGRIVRPGSVAWESVQPVSRSLTSAWEGLSRVAKTAVGAWESGGLVGVLRSIPWEAAGQGILRRLRTLLWVGE
jgi:hypothetical protein